MAFESVRQRWGHADTTTVSEVFIRRMGGTRHLRDWDDLVWNWLSRGDGELRRALERNPKSNPPKLDLDAIQELFDEPVDLPAPEERLAQAVGGAGAAGGAGVREAASQTIPAQPAPTEAPEPAPASPPSTLAADAERILREQQETLDAAGEFVSGSTEDAKRKTFRALALRQGQPEFRASLIAAYGSRCAVTGCDAVEALEAAHILPYVGPDSNQPGNGLLLRADLHTLFDRGLIAVDTATMTLRIAEKLATTVYGEFAGKPVHVPDDEASRPKAGALNQHREHAGL